MPDDTSAPAPAVARAGSRTLFSVPVQGMESDERYTPRWVFDGMGITFDLDPYSPVDGGDHVPARSKFTREDDGLSREWVGTVWVNPPFSHSAAWSDRFREHGNGVFLGPVANGRWWNDLANDADLLWWCRDFAFVHPTHAGKRSSMPLAFASMGPEPSAALDRLARSNVHGGVLVTAKVPTGPLVASEVAR